MNGTPITDTEKAQIIALANIEPQLKYSAIAAKLDRPLGSITGHLSKAIRDGLAPRRQVGRGPTVPIATRKRIIHLASQHPEMDYAAIGTLTHTPPGTVGCILMQAIRNREAPPRQPLARAHRAATA